jgi:hypothetical protein
MSEVGLLNSRYDLSQRSLEAFDEGLYHLWGKHQRGDSDTSRHINSLLSILSPLSERMQNQRELSVAEEIDESSIIETLKQRKRSSDWDTFRFRLNNLVERLKRGESDITADDSALLNDVADALNHECSQYFKRSGGK